ncbi:MAG TPA: PAS domain S-box protein [Paracoccus sp.]|nr:PAS domain S-box protein [Paracoccus sp. (in: a-proteobacteria)]
MPENKVHDDLERLAAIVSSSDDAIISKTLDGTITTWNAGAEKILGFSADEMIGQPILKIIPPELREEEARILARIGSGERIKHFETVRLAKDGRRVDLSLTVSPLRDREGRIAGASKVARDIGERRRADQLRQTLVDELNHRVKNTLALVQSIAAQSQRTTPDPAAFVAAFNSRISALARAHDLLLRENLTGVNLRDLLHHQVVLGNDDVARISMEGPDLVVGGSVGAHLGLIVHELATNARKHGALAGMEGTVRIRWGLERRDDMPCLMLDWHEDGMAGLQPAKREGFGTTLLKRVASACEGSVDVQDGPSGRRIRLQLPLEHYRLAPAQAEKVAGKTAGREGARALEGKRVLIVEDEFIIAMDIEATLHAEGCTVLGPAITVEQALVQIYSHSLDLAILDANLRGKSVEPVAEALAGKGVPFVFATGYGAEALPAGWGDHTFLGKPFGSAQLVAALRALLPQA